MDIRSLIVKALRKKYEADIEQAKTTVNIYLERPVGIGEHPQHLEEVDKLISVIVDAEDKMRALNNHFDDDIPF
jgi:hypothetical protein